MNYPDYFKHWKKLSWIEKFIFRTCCYIPPKHNVEKKERKLHPLSHYQQLYERAFGTQFWDHIKDKVILDFGCGYGEFVLAVAGKEPLLAIGVDILDNPKQGEQMAKTLGLKNTEFIIGSSQKIPSKSIDVITSHDAFEHFDDPEGVLKEMVRLVKPGGQLFIKFGPTWMSPWGRHMSGTFRKDRPWIHLIFSEKNMMRVHSAYHNEDILLERYDQRPGGLNKMSVKKCRNIIKSNPNITVEHFEVIMLYNWNFLKAIPLLNELFSSAVSMRLKVT